MDFTAFAAAVHPLAAPSADVCCFAGRRFGRLQWLGLLCAEQRVRRRWAAAARSDVSQVTRGYSHPALTYLLTWFQPRESRSLIAPYSRLPDVDDPAGRPASIWRGVTPRTAVPP